MNNPIVCGVDGSAGSSRAAAFAALMGEQLGREATLVHVDSEPPGIASISRARNLRDLRRMAGALGFPSHTRVHVTGGEPAEEIVGIAGQLDAELVVLGSRGRHELGAAVLGSVSTAVMRNAPCPVVVVPPDASLPTGLTQPSIVCGVEGSDRDPDVLRLADDLRSRLGGALHAVHARDPSPVAPGPAGIAPPLMPELDEAAHARLAASLRESGVEAHAAVVSLPAALALQRVAAEKDATLIVIGCRGRGKVASVLLGSVAVQLAADASCPVVVLPPTAELAPGSGNYEIRAGAA